MTKLDSMTMRVEAFEEQTRLDQAQLAAAAYLARYNNRTLDAYRHDLRTFFQWAADIGPGGTRSDPGPHRVVPGHA